MTDDRLLVALLAMWKRSGGHDPATDVELVRAIEIVGERATYGRTLPKQTSWLAAVKRGDPVERGLLLAAIEETKRAELVARWTAILAFDDPRCSGKLAERPVATKKAELEAILELQVAAARDRRIVAALERTLQDASLSKPRRALVADAHAEAVAALQDIAAKPLSAKDVALVQATIASDAGAREARERREADLLAAIYAAPFDDAPRSIYADWLLEQGDPRGEFIVLQLADAKRALTSAENGRVKRLLAAYRDTWLGPLAPYRVRFHRGFPQSCWWEDATPVDDPRWATVEETDRMPPPSGLRALRRVDIARTDDVARLGELAEDSPLESLSWNDCKPGPERDAAIAAYRNAKLPALRALRITQYGAPDEIWDALRTGWVFEGRQLTSVSLPGDPAQLAAYLDLFVRHEPTLERLHIGLALFHLTRQDGALHLQLSVGSDSDARTIGGLESLAPNAVGAVTVSTIGLTLPVRERIAAIMARHDCCRLSFE